MKVFFLMEYYPEYLAYFYEKYPSVADMAFEEHRNRIFDDHFSWQSDLSRYMNTRGIDTEFIIANAEILQKRWAEENGFRDYFQSNWKKRIAMEQIKRFRPDVLWVTSSFEYYGTFVKEALGYSRKAIAWIGSPFTENVDVKGFSTLLTENPNTLRSLQNRFKKVIVTKPFFNPEILSKIGPVKKNYDVTFVGGISPMHKKRADILNYLIKQGVKIKVFGYLCEQKSLRRPAFLKSDYQRNVEFIKSRHSGPVFGLDMYRTLASSYITLNIHIDVAGDNAGNMRMFEASGVGTCLLTEHFGNINDLFKPGGEILTYTSKENLLEIIQNMLNNNRAVRQIAKAGQRRTLCCHTIERMFKEIQPAIS